MNELYIKLRALILSLINCEVVQGLGNGVPMPAGPFIAMTAVAQLRLSTNTTTATATTRTVRQAIQYAVQVDCFGPDAADWAATLSTMLRDTYACSLMGPDVQPLHADDPKSMPLVNGEENYEQRWTVTAMIQSASQTTVLQDSANALNVGLINVDAEYPPV